MCFVRDQTRAGVANPWGVPNRSTNSSRNINSSITQRGERLSVSTTTSTLTICRPIPIHPWPIHPTLPITTSTTSTSITRPTRPQPPSSLSSLSHVPWLIYSPPHTTHGSDLIHFFQHKSSPSFNNHEVSNAMPFTHSPPSFTRHTYRTSTTATSINNNDVYQEDSTKQNKSTQTL